MNRNLKRTATYIKMSLLFMILGAIILYIAGAPLASYCLAHADMAIVKGAPGYLSKPIVQTKVNPDQSEIQRPELDTQYGTISCDKIALTAPVYYGDSDYALANGIGQYSLGGMPGEGKPILLSGHDGTFFAPLENITAGDVVSITTDYGKFEYQVVSTKVADKADQAAYDLSQDKEQLILYTCYPFGKVTGDRSDRYFVYCDRITDATEAVQ